jgi:hypothetical protein
LAGCAADGPDEADPHAMWGILRYVDDGGTGEPSDAEPGEAGDA